MKKGLKNRVRNELILVIVAATLGTIVNYAFFKEEVTVGVFLEQLLFFSVLAILDLGREFKKYEKLSKEEVGITKWIYNIKVALYFMGALLFIVVNPIGLNVIVNSSIASWAIIIVVNIIVVYIVRFKNKKSLNDVGFTMFITNLLILLGTFIIGNFFM